MVRTKAAPRPTFAPVRQPTRTILVSASLTPFCEAVYRLGLDPYLAYRAESQEHAAAMQRTWQKLGIPSTVETLAEQAAAERPGRFPITDLLRKGDTHA